MKKVVILISFAIAFLQAESFTFYLLVPGYKEWLESPPVIKNLANDELVSMEEDADGYHGWFHYTWEKNVIPDSVLIYSHIDTLFLDPIGMNGFCSKNVSPLMMKMLSEIAGSKSIFFIANSEYAEMTAEVDEGGFAYFDVRPDVHYAKEMSFTYYSKKLFALVPDYKEWIQETPVVVDAENSSKFWEMLPDEEFNGWFSYSWSHCSESPKSIYLYKKTDSLGISPIGANGFAYGETELVPLDLQGSESVYFYPDLNYDCSISEYECYCGGVSCYCGVQEPATWKNYDVRSVCQLEKNCLKDDFEPYYYSNKKVFALLYRIYSSKGELLVPEKEMTSDSNDVAIYEKGSFTINGKSLPNGDYILKYRQLSYGREMAERVVYFSVNNGAVVMDLLKERKNIALFGVKNIGKTIQISSTKLQSYTVLNAMGQVLARGKVNGTANVMVPNSGMYFVKVGSEIHRLNVR